MYWLIEINKFFELNFGFFSKNVIIFCFKATYEYLVIIVEVVSKSGNKNKCQMCFILRILECLTLEML